MPTFVMVTQVSPESLGSPQTLEELERDAMNNIRGQCPQVHWISSYAVLGRFDYVDVFDAPDVDTAAKVSLLARVHGHARSEVMPATEWPRFEQMIHVLE
jgi:hypothetical protein